MAKKKILMVDDEKEWVKMLTLRLEHNGYEVDIAFDTAGGISQAIKLRPDCILLDIMMPAGGGIMALENFRKNANTFNIPVIVVTAKPDNQTKEIAEKLGVSGYFIKPIDAAKLMEKIKEVLLYK